ncbi:translation initiation factor IF-2 subunit alpha [Candidatus Micrarchaeota archaeon]|nr:translation initiation factor IF-2 subunit alpha [Candidatus Micrarchaeota archaeon]
MAGYPEVGEFVIASVIKIMPYGAFLSLDEYSAMEGFLHISEVSSGWVKNIRDHVKEGQKVVVMISRVDHEKRQIDLSLKRVSDNDRKRKMEAYQLGKRAEKLLERGALKLKKTLKEAYTEAGDLLIKEYGDLFLAFEALKAGTCDTAIPAPWKQALAEIAEVEIKEKEIHVRANLTLQSFDSEGVEHVKKILLRISKSTPRISLKYLGAPKYFIDIPDTDYKRAEKSLLRIEHLLEKESRIQYSMQKVKV